MSHAPSQTVLVTGANGFVGRRLCGELARRGYAVRAVVRPGSEASAMAQEVSIVPAIDAATDWSSALQGVDTVVHLAARVHVMRETAQDPLEAFRAVNVGGTEALGRAAGTHGVKRIVYVSSIKVNGEVTTRHPFSPNDLASPSDAYGVSKWEAERVLREIGESCSLEVTVVRPPLVYGHGVGGNFLRLLRLVRRGVPLPFGAIDNRRSMIFNGNLADALIACAFHPCAAGKTYLVRDGEDLSTPDLLARLAAAMGVSPRIWPVPSGILRFAGLLTGRAAEVDRLIGSLVVDDSDIRSDLGWRPPFSVEQGLSETVAGFKSAAR